MRKKKKDNKEFPEMDEVLKVALNTPPPKKGISLAKKKFALLKALQNNAKRRKEQAKKK